MKKKIQLLLKKISALAIIFAIFSVAVPIGAAAENDLPDFYAREDFGRSIWTIMTQGSAICYDSAGNAILCYGVQGGVFCAIDIKTGKVIKEEALYGVSQLGSMVTASDGIVYFNPYSLNGLKKYDPKTNTISDVSGSGYDRNGGFMRSSFADTDGKVYFGSYHDGGGVIYIYNTKTNTTTVTDVVKEGAHYIQGICADEKYIYAGTGISPYAAIVRINKETGEKTEFASNEASIFNAMRIVGNYLLADVNGGIVIYDLTTLERVGNQATGTVSAASPLKENVIYFASPYDGNMYEYNINTKKVTYVVKNPISEWKTIGETGMNWAKIDGEWVIEYHSEHMKYVGYFNPSTKINVLNKTSKIADTGPQVQSLEISPDNVIYMGGYQTGMTAYNINKGEFDYIESNWKQNEGVGFLNGKVYFGVYTDARIWRYDPEKEWNYTLYNGDGKYQGHSANPAMVYDIDDEQDRPFVVKGYKDKLYIGTMSGYGKLGGALTIYEEDEDGNPSAITYRNLDPEQTVDGIIPGQSITGIAVKDNLVYLSGTIRGGKGKEPEETEAKMAVFDTNTGKFVVEPFVPDLPVDGSTTIGEISFGPDGLLWGCSEKDGLIFAMDPKTFDVIKSVSLLPGDDRGALARPLYIRWGDDGNLYTTATWEVYVVNPETLEFKKIEPNCSLMDIDNDGNVWVGKGNGFFRIKINQHDRFQGFIKSVEKLNAEDYFEKEYNELIKEYNNAKNLISESSSDDIIISTINRLKRKKDKLVRKEDYITDLGVSVDYAKQAINISGNLPGDSGLAVQIYAPDGSIVMYDQFEKNSDNSFSKAYRIDTIQEGKYSVYIQGVDIDYNFKAYADAVLPENAFAADSFLSNSDGISAGAEVSNYYSDRKEVSVHIAFYEIIDGKKRLYDLKILNKEIRPGEHVYLSDIMDSEDDKEIMVLVWEKGEIRPLIPTKSIKNNSSSD